jgi:hypothetical protein
MFLYKIIEIKPDNILYMVYTHNINAQVTEIPGFEVGKQCGLPKETLIKLIKTKQDKT